MTPESISRSYDTSIIVRRWLGAWVDFIALFGILLAADYTLGNALYQKTLPVWIALIVAYFPMTEGLTGRSLGKLLTGTIVVDSHGRIPGVGKACLRTVTRIFEVNPVLFGGVPAGLFALSGTRQRLGDMVAHTFVLKTRDLGRLADSEAAQPLAPAR